MDSANAFDLYLMSSRDEYTPPPPKKKTKNKNKKQQQKTKNNNNKEQSETNTKNIIGEGKVGGEGGAASAYLSMPSIRTPAKPSLDALL